MAYFVETSAKKNDKVEEAFVIMGKMLYKRDQAKKTQRESMTRKSEKE